MKEKKAKVTKDPKRFELSMPIGPVRKAVAAAGAQTNETICARIENAANAAIRKACEAKQFKQSVGNCIGGPGSPPLVDLVVVIDVSGSMRDEAKKLSDAASAAIQAAAQSCPSDLRVAWFGIEGVWNGTLFTQPYRTYLNGISIPDTDLVGTPKDTEDGAAAVVDLSDHFDWRLGASRSIFYLGDEALEGGDPQNAADIAANDAAIAAAKAAGVTVFTYFGTNQGANPTTESEYERLATSTGGQAFVAPVANLGGFQAILEQIICAAPVEHCRPAEISKIVPCISLHWGDGPKDQFETKDTEVICFTVCNPYSNVALKNFTLHIGLMNAGGGQVPLLPDGSPAAYIKPNTMICFGDIPPCDPNSSDLPCVSREAVFVGSGAAPGRYKIAISYCFDSSFTVFESGSAFDIELVKN